jgi:hypothetical protein
MQSKKIKTNKHKRRRNMKGGEIDYNATRWTVKPEDITGTVLDLTRFTRLTQLYCNNLGLTEITNFPNTLRLIDCNRNALQTLPELPPNLTVLNCSMNNLTSLPNLPQNLVDLSCNYNNLQTLPELPNSLRELVCTNNQLTSLPDMPSYLDKLFCSNNRLTYLPRLNDNLRVLDATYNEITVLPLFLPIALTALYISHNPLIEPIYVRRIPRGFRCDVNLTLKPENPIRRDINTIEKPENRTNIPSLRSLATNTLSTQDISKARNKVGVFPGYPVKIQDDEPVGGKKRTKRRKNYGKKNKSRRHK